MAYHYDCPSCACLVRTRDTACPFCGAALRSGAAPGWRVLGLVVSLGAATVSCSDKDADTMETSDEGHTSEEGTTTTTGVSSTNPSGTGDTTMDDMTTSSGSASSSSTTAGGTTWDTADASTYAGPDETATIDPHALPDRPEPTP